MITGRYQLKINRGVPTLRPRSDWDLNCTDYAYNEDFRDTVRYKGFWYAVKKFQPGIFVPKGAEPSVESKWWTISGGVDYLYKESIQTEHLAAGSITADKIKAKSITADQIDIDTVFAKQAYIGPFNIIGNELTNSNYNACINIKAIDGSYVKIGNSLISTFHKAKVAIHDLKGRASGIYSNILKSSDINDMFHIGYNALEVIGQSMISGRNYTEHTLVSGSSNIPQLLAVLLINDLGSGIMYNMNYLWWDANLYSFENPVYSVRRTSEGVYKFTHKLLIEPSYEEPVTPGKHVTDFMVKAYPIGGGGGGSLYAAMTNKTKTTFEIRTADDATANNAPGLIVEIYNITHIIEFANYVKQAIKPHENNKL